jgi:GNAT superfamily N-acetyltransferase
VIIKLVNENDIRKIEDGFPELAEELLQIVRYSPVAAAMIAGNPVSFCSGEWETESLWDIGIETLPEYRRHGYAEQCVQFMVAHHLQRGKHPVWGAEESNLASLNLAAKLGFKAVDRVVLFRRSGE